MLLPSVLLRGAALFCAVAAAAAGPEEPVPFPRRSGMPEVEAPAAAAVVLEVVPWVAALVVVVAAVVVVVVVIVPRCCRRCTTCLWS